MDKKKRGTLSKKILSITLPMMMVLSVLITGIYYLYSRKTIENSTYSLIAAEAKAESVSISKYIIKTLSQLDAV